MSLGKSNECYAVEAGHVDEKSKLWGTLIAKHYSKKNQICYISTQTFHSLEIYGQWNTFCFHSQQIEYNNVNRISTLSLRLLPGRMTAWDVSARASKQYVHTEVTKPCCSHRIFNGSKQGSQVILLCSDKACIGGEVRLDGWVSKRSDFNMGDCCSFPVYCQQSMLDLFCFFMIVL